LTFIHGAYYITRARKTQLHFEQYCEKKGRKR